MMQDYYALTADEREAERQGAGEITLEDLYAIIGTMNSQDHYYLALDELVDAVVARRYGERIIETEGGRDGRTPEA